MDADMRHVLGHAERTADVLDWSARCALRDTAGLDTVNGTSRPRALLHVHADGSVDFEVGTRYGQGPCPTHYVKLPLTHPDGSPRAADGEYEAAAIVRAALDDGAWDVVAAAARLAATVRRHLTFSHERTGWQTVVPWVTVQLDPGEVTLIYQVSLPYEPSTAHARFIRRVAVTEECTYAYYASGRVIPSGYGLGVAAHHRDLDLFREFGVETVVAELTGLGSYVWLRHGFQPDAPHWLADRMLDVVEGVQDVDELFDDRQLADPKAARDAVEAWQRGDITLQEVADLGRDRPDRYGQHDGKKLLVGLSWDAELDLRDTDAPTWELSALVAV